MVEDYSGTFWNEDRLIHNHKCALDVVNNPAKFPNADVEQLDQTMIAIERALLDKFGGSAKAVSYLTQHRS